ncbi:hypothetical protein [Roseateles sp. MS654]|uniref:hypothetical protein n=1 Tax=Roseateles sp. MS654 TaxID=3412685 RepID=UPI003C2F1F89
MLNQIECNEHEPLAECGSEPEWPHPRWVRVDSKSQAPYKFYPCFNPCSPHEWPFDLQALHGTQDWDDVINWFLQRNPEMPRDDLLRFASTVVDCARGRPVSVEVCNDPELALLSLWFTLWGYTEDEDAIDSHEIKSMERFWFATPAFRRLMGDVGVDARYGAFEDRHSWQRD